MQTPNQYAAALSALISSTDWGSVDRLIEELSIVRQAGKQVFLCGNGGSAANAMHIANDFLYGVSSPDTPGLRVEALSANSSVLTCLANDVGYADIFSEQLATKGNPGDLLIVLSGSGNSANIIKAVELGNKMEITTAGILGFDGGRCKDLLRIPVHFNIDDMQISEDLQLIVGHMCMKNLTCADHTVV